MAENKLKVTQTGSTIGRPDDQRATLVALGLGRIGRSRIIADTAASRGRVEKVKHLVRVESVAAE